jgi:hypothetical protein
LEKTELVKDVVFGPAGFVGKDAVSSLAKLRFRSGFATLPEEAPGSSYLGEVSQVLPSPVRYGDFFDMLRVLEFDLKSRVEEVNQALVLGDAHGLKSPEIGPRPLQVYQRSRGRLPKPSKPSGPSSVASVAASLEAGSPEAAAVVPPVASAAVGSDAAPPVVPVVRGKQFFFPPILEDVPMFAGLVKRSSGSKTTPRREAIQLYRTTRSELEHRILTACFVYFGDKDWG